MASIVCRAEKEGVYAGKNFNNTCVEWQWTLLHGDARFAVRYTSSWNHYTIYIDDEVIARKKKPSMLNRSKSKKAFVHTFITKSNAEVTLSDDNGTVMLLPADTPSSLKVDGDGRSILSREDSRDSRLTDCSMDQVERARHSLPNQKELPKEEKKGMQHTLKKMVFGSRKQRKQDEDEDESDDGSSSDNVGEYDEEELGAITEEGSSIANSTAGSPMRATHRLDSEKLGLHKARLYEDTDVQERRRSLPISPSSKHSRGSKDSRGRYSSCSSENVEGRQSEIDVGIVDSNVDSAPVVIAGGGGQSPMSQRSQDSQYLLEEIENAEIGESVERMNSLSATGESVEESNDCSPIEHDT